MEFTKYMHLERLGTREVQGIEIGKTYVFPKLDGTNASVWLDNSGEIAAGSRNRTLSIGADNAGFYNFAIQCPNIKSYLEENPSDVLHGEWLVPHSLKTYQDTAWRRFYVFDVNRNGVLLSYDDYQFTVENHNLDYISPLSIINNASVDMFERELEKNTFMIKDGDGYGEGIVIKNYGFINDGGRQVWAKLVTNSFKEKHIKSMGPAELTGDIIEQKIVEKYVTDALVNKVYDKIAVSSEGWQSKFIPRLLNTVFYDLVKEETWEFIKENKNPKIDFGLMQRYCFTKVKEIRTDVF